MSSRAVDNEYCRHERALCALLESGDFAGFGETLRAWLSGIPYQWHAKGELARYEAWYASLLYMCLRAVAVELRVEEASHRGRADMVVRLGGQVFVLEFKPAPRPANTGQTICSWQLLTVRLAGRAGTLPSCVRPFRANSSGWIRMSDHTRVTIARLDAIQDAFNRHDVDGILSYFAEDGEWLMARGPDPWEARRLRGKQAIGDVLRARYAVIPDMRWVDMRHFIDPDGTRACSEWTVKGTPREGVPLDWLGCDLWTFRDGLITKKDTYWKYIDG